MTLPIKEKKIEKLVNKVKDTVAKDYGYQDGIIGTRWEYAMMITHRTKKQIELWEKVGSVLAELAMSSKLQKEL